MRRLVRESVIGSATKTRGLLRKWEGRHFCIHTAVTGFNGHGGARVEEEAAWAYATPSPAFAVITDHVAFYAGRMDACFVDGEPVVAQPGGFYGGWITSRVVGPFKGGPGSWGW